MDKQSKIFVAGGDNLIGSAISRILHKQGFNNVIDTSKEPDLSNFLEVETFFQKENPQYVFLVAGKSGGITANQKYPADFMMDNLLKECHIIEHAYKKGVTKLLYLASSCCYPKNCPQPMQEVQLLNGPLEPTNEPYAIAKIAGLKLAQSFRKQYGANFICGIPANCFGPGDDFSEENSHVIGALMRRMTEAKEQNKPEVSIWGTGKPRREFIYCDDLADACIFVMQNYDDLEPINLGPGGDFSISDLAGMVKEVSGFRGNLVFDSSKPDGMPVKLLDTTKLKKLGWKTQMSFYSALEQTYKWYLLNY